MSAVHERSWPVEALGKALVALVERAGLGHPSEPPAPSSRALEDVLHLEEWLASVVRPLGLEAEPVQARGGEEVEQLLRDAGPALLPFSVGGERRVLALVRGGRRQVEVLGPDLEVHRLPLEVLREAVCAELEAPVAREVEAVLGRVKLPESRRARVRQEMLRQRTGHLRLGPCWMLRPTPGTTLWGDLVHAGVPLRLLGFLGTHGVHYLLWLASWALLGKAVLQGRLTRELLLGWGLLLLTLVPFQALSAWAQGRVALGLGAVLKERLLRGALRLEPEELRRQGIGQFLGQVMEAEAVERLSLGGGLGVLTALLELLVAGLVLHAGAGGGWMAWVLAGWLGLAAALGWAHARRWWRWSHVRLELTHDLVERLVGHRTRLAQEPAGRWNQEEDQLLARYTESGRSVGTLQPLLGVLVPRGWLVLGLAGCTTLLVVEGSAPVPLALTVGGVLLARQALGRLVEGYTLGCGAVLAWRHVAPLSAAAARPESTGSPLALTDEQGAASGQPLLEADGLGFSHRQGQVPVLRECRLRLSPGDRVLLEGSSGSGKSTLASLLAGLREPSSGMLLMGGVDRHTLGAARWSRRVVAVPQFHENHVLSATFAFNLMMGGRWPPTAADVERAEAICQELGLGPLLARMPGGMFQMVGESGWQLSHGERSRLFLARALLQEPELLVLDESFAALDPETLRRCLQRVLDRARTLVVIAHP